MVLKWHLGFGVALDSGMDRGSLLADCGVEACCPVSYVVYDTSGAVRLDQTVLSSDDVTVALFVLVLVVPGVRVVHAVLEGVPGVVVLEAQISKS